MPPRRTRLIVKRENSRERKPGDKIVISTIRSGELSLHYHEAMKSPLIKASLHHRLFLSATVVSQFDGWGSSILLLSSFSRVGGTICGTSPFSSTELRGS